MTHQQGWHERLTLSKQMSILEAQAWPPSSSAHDVSLTRCRSPVRSWPGVFLPVASICARVPGLIPWYNMSASGTSVFIGALPLMVTRSPGWREGGRARRQIDATARGFEPLRAEPNGFRVHHLSHSVTLSCSLHACTTWPVCYSSESCESCRTSVHEVMLNTPCALVVSSLT